MSIADWQRALAARGFDAGPADGIWGRAGLTLRRPPPPESLAARRMRRHVEDMEAQMTRAGMDPPPRVGWE